MELKFGSMRRSLQAEFSNVYHNYKTSCSFLSALMHTFLCLLMLMGLLNALFATFCQWFASAKYSSQNIKPLAQN